MPRGAPAPAQQAQQIRGAFETDTRQSIYNMPNLVPPSAGTAGQISTGQLPTAGYLGAIWGIVQGTTTTAAASSTTVKAYPQPPWGYLRRLRLYSNMGVELFNLTGYGLYLYMRTLRAFLDLDASFPTLQYSTTDSGNNANRSRYLQRPSSLGASTSETWRFPIYLPVTWGSMGKAGYQLLQDDAVKFYLEATWGDSTDLYSATTGTVTLSNVSLRWMVETYATPRNPVNRPDLSYSKWVSEESQVVTTGSGLNTVKLVTGNIITKIIHEVANGTTQAPADPTEFSLVRLDYGGTQVPYNADPDLTLLRQRWMYGGDLPQSVYVWELSNALGLVELPTMRDAIDTLMLTNLQSELQVTGMTPTNSNLRTIKEFLVPNRTFGG